MNVLAVIANPNPGSFNYALLDRAIAALEKRGDEIRILDLYQSGFDPRLKNLELAELQAGNVSDEVLAEQKNLRWADALLFIYPLWWFDRPAVLKGWCDRVLTQGFAFNFGESGVEGLLTDIKAMVIVTAGGSEAEFKDMNVSERDLVLPMVKGTLGFCGIGQIHSKVFYSVATASDEEREGYLDRVSEMVRTF